MADACQNYGLRSHYVSAMHFTRNPSLSPNVRHVSAPAVRSKRSGAPPPRSVRWETRLGPPAAVAPFARALRGSDPVQSASRLDGPVRPAQTWAAAALPQVFASSLTRTYQKGSNAIVPVDAKIFRSDGPKSLLPKTVVRISFGWPVTPPLSYGRQGVSGVPRACDRLQWEHRRRTGQRAKGQSEAARRGRS